MEHYNDSDSDAVKGSRTEDEMRGDIIQSFPEAINTSKRDASGRENEKKFRGVSYCKYICMCVGRI